MRNSTLASAALTSVALLAQTANATPSLGDETPSRDEVSRRVSSLYDQAESDTGTFNATRAAAKSPRARVSRPADAGRRPATVARNDESRRGDPAPAGVTRQWFDAARAKLGPTDPATLHRSPERPTGTRPARAGDARGDRALEASGRTALELPAAPAAESPAASAGGPAPLAELTAGPVAALPAASEAPQETTRTALALPAPAAETAIMPVIEPVIESTVEPAIDPHQRSSLQATKEKNQRKLAQARELLSSHASQQSTARAAIEAGPAADTWSAAPASDQDWAETQWQVLQEQRVGDLTTVPANTTAWPATPEVAVDALAATDTSQALDPGHAIDPAQAIGPAPAIASTAPQGTRAVRALDFARAQLGKPCVWGTTGPNTYDGAGLTQAAWKAAGITLPRTPQEQATAGRGIALPYAEPGDLVLFHAGHVGIYSGNGMMIHAPGPGALIREESIHYAGESAIHSVIRPA
ncbi:C40 family peptidase [Streptomyces curacoi]|uniref:NlpC/P60 domain-containing protein n=1 Tax=Streptomyces curacoi TaxID=146536 RepID=A0A124H014_9ACTN|nr:C40 family peptidase [Streptomyces curacoi]KUM73623.1 hypothetical protein AQI70_23040 [Streptomyces curacoi]